jgi:hypothetical protein
LEASGLFASCLVTALQNVQVNQTELYLNGELSFSLYI